MGSWQKRPWLWSVVSSAGLFCVVCSALLLVRYYNFYPTYASFDQGIFDQVFWNGLHGRFFQSSLSSTLSSAVVHDGEAPAVFYHRLGQHFTPALLIWLPFYALFSSPAGLSILQVLIIAAAGLVLYALAREYHPPRLSAFIAISFYAANAVIGPTLANFHDLCQIPLFVFGLLLALEKRWWWLLAGLAVLTLLVREDAGVVLFGVGFYLVVSQRFPRLGLALCSLSFGYMLLVTNVIMPLFSEDISRRFMIEQFGQYVEGDEASSLEVIWAILSQPWLLISELLTPLDRTLGYLLAQWLPLAFIPAISPSAWAIAGFPLLQNLMRDDPTALSIDLRYALIPIPGLFYGTILWWSQHGEWFQKGMRRFWIVCLTVSLILIATSNPNRALSFLIPDSFQPWVYVSLPRQSQHAQVIRQFMAEIPPTASVSATTHIVPHLSNRRELVRFPELQIRTDQQEVESIEYVLLDLWQMEQYQVAFTDDRRELQQTVRALNRVLRSDRYGIRGFEDGVILLQAEADSDPQAVQSWNAYKQAIAPILQES